MMTENTDWMETPSGTGMTVIPAHLQTLATGSALLVAVSLNHLLVREKVQM
jgi:hypothetical protein